MLQLSEIGYKIITIFFQLLLYHLKTNNLSCRLLLNIFQYQNFSTPLDKKEKHFRWLIALEDQGKIPYSSGWNTIDIAGLTTNIIARDPDLIGNALVKYCLNIPIQAPMCTIIFTL